MRMCVPFTTCLPCVFLGLTMIWRGLSKKKKKKGKWSSVKVTALYWAVAFPLLKPVFKTHSFTSMYYFVLQPCTIEYDIRIMYG